MRENSFYNERLGLRRHRAGNKLLHKSILAGHVRLSIVWELQSKCLLQVAVGSGLRRMSAEIIPECHMPLKFAAVGRANIEVMSRSAGRGKKCFTFRDAKISLVHITKTSEALNSYREHGVRSQQHIDVDDGLRR